MLVTGVAGYIGSHFALACIEAGWRMIGIDDLSVGNRSSVPQDVVFHQADIGDPVVGDVARREGAVAAVHFAALISVAESMERPHAHFDTNLGRARRFFDSVTEAGIRSAVFSSTAAVYGDAGGRAGPRKRPTCAGIALRLVQARGRTGAPASRRARGLDAVILRYFNVAGADPRVRAGPRPGATHLIKVVSEAATCQRDRVVINGEDYPTPDGTAVRAYIHVSDLAEAQVAAVRHLLRGGGSAILNCGYGRGHSVRQVVEAAQRQAPRGFDVAVGGRRPGDVGSIVADARGLRQPFDRRPRHDDLDLILRSAIQWGLQHQSAEASGAARCC